MAQFAQPQHPQKHWKDDAIAWSEGITDAWEVTKVITGRLAEWILFGCMIANIIGILPGVSLPPLVTNIVMGIQIVTLDIAGFGLATMAENARANGAEKAANEATATAYLLIAIMMLTLVLFTLGIMVPALKPFTSIAENVLILVRVGMIVFYGHVVHSLRRVSANAPATPKQMTALQEELEAQRQEIERLLQHQQQELQQTVTRLETQSNERLQVAIEALAQRFSGHVTVVAENASELFLALPETSETAEPTTETLAIQKPLNDAVKPIETVSETDRNMIVAAYEQGITRRKMCAHLGWGSAKYSVVKAVLDAYQKQVGTPETALTESE